MVSCYKIAAKVRLFFHTCKFLARFFCLRARGRRTKCRLRTDVLPIADGWRRPSAISVSSIRYRQFVRRLRAPLALDETICLLLINKESTSFWLILIKSIFFRPCFSEKSPGNILVFRGKFVPLHPLNRQGACEALGKSSLKSLHRQREVVQEAAGARPLPGSGRVALHPRVQDCEVAVDFLFGSGVVPFA